MNPGLERQHLVDATTVRTNLEIQAIGLPGQFRLCKCHSLLVTSMRALESPGFVPHLCHFLAVLSQPGYLTSLSLCDWR